ncbi:MAG: TIGR03118 family protein [Chitinophagaceae bacterium]
MKHVFQKHTRLLFAPLFFICLMFSSCQKNIQETKEEDLQVAKVAKSFKDFTQVNLVDNNGEYDAAIEDPNLINGWGIAFSSGGTAWVSSEAVGVSAVYNREGVIQGISPVAIPSPGAATGGHPSGQVFNTTAADFILTNGSKAAFIFAGLDGVISGWNGGAGTAAIKMIDSSSSNAVYAGITLASDGGANFLYAANFSAGRIDVFDKDFKSVTTKPFWDPDIPAGYAPFNIQNIAGKLYVMYAKVDPEEHEEEVGPGLGYVDIYNADGTLDKRFASKGQLNAPWGVAMAPASFFGDDGQPAILVGNFGDGHINAYNLDGVFIGQLRAHGEPIVIEGLWAITFPPSTSTIDPNRLYFAAGPDDETEGLFGYIIK